MTVEGQNSFGVGDSHYFFCSFQGVLGEIQKVQDEINKLQEEFTEDLATSSVDSSDQLAMQSSLTVLAERMATIHMKASGKQQLLEVVSMF